LLTRRAGTLLVLSALVSAVSVSWAVVLGVAVLVVAAVDGRRAPTPTVGRRVVGDRSLNAVVDVVVDVAFPEGERTERTLRTVRVTDDLGSGMERLPWGGDDTVVDASSPTGAMVEVVGDTGTRVGYRLALRKRGDLLLGDVHLRVMGPLGLGWGPKRVPMEDRIRVQPGMEELRRERMAALRPHMLMAGLRRLRRFGEGTEFESLREYGRGDDPRTIDWKASARRTDLLVRNYQVERNQSVVLALDAGRLMREWIHDRERLDFAISAALLVAERARVFGDRVGLLVFDDRVRLVRPVSRMDLGELSDALAGIESRLVEPNYPMAFATLKRTFRKRSLVILFSDIIDAAASRALVQGAVSTAARHLPMVVALRNPEVEEVASRPGRTEADVFRQAAAEELLEARAGALQSMRRSGVQVVDALPGAACHATLAKYAEVKRRGLL